jgi:bis(5'-nucleosyl)-tetraphosphatase (symmetrical)
METWFVGDLQGCAGALSALEAALPTPQTQRHLAFAGDLVNRGEDSPACLRRVRALQAAGQGTTVLGNHDLHLLACAAGLRSPRGRDTIQDVLDAPDRDELILWLRHQPLAVCLDGWLLVHAGVLPGWTVEDVLAVHHAAHDRLRDPHAYKPFLARVVGQRDRVEPIDDPEEALAFRVGVLTRIRCVDRASHQLAPAYTGPLADVPADLLPWFDALPHPGVPASHAPSAPVVPVVTGHWAAIGPVRTHAGWSIDGGCVWGGTLNALRARDESLCRVAGQHP